MNFLKGLDLKKVSLQTILGGAAVYVGAKQSGVPEGQAIFAGVISALTSGLAAGTDTRKPASEDPPSDSPSGPGAGGIY